MAQRYQDDDEFSLLIRSISALAFVPEEDVEDAFLTMEIHIRETYADDANIDAIDSVLDYFEDTYIGRSRRGRARAQPKFPIGLWNVVSRTEMDLPRTNNNVEGWHNRFSSIINGAHPTLWKFLENLKAEEILSRAETAQILGGHQFPAKKKYADSAKRVKKLVSEYPSRSSNVVSYLHGIAHNLKF